MLAVGRIQTAPTSLNPWGKVTVAGTRRPCYFDPRRFLVGFYVAQVGQLVSVQEQRVGLVAIGILGQG